jgi:hypothetical protein
VEPSIRAEIYYSTHGWRSDPPPASGPRRRQCDRVASPARRRPGRRALARSRIDRRNPGSSWVACMCMFVKSVTVATSSHIALCEQPARDLSRRDHNGPDSIDACPSAFPPRLALTSMPPAWTSKTTRTRGPGHWSSGTRPRQTPGATLIRAEYRPWRSDVLGPKFPQSESSRAGASTYRDIGPLPRVRQFMAAFRVHGRWE